MEPASVMIDEAYDLADDGKTSEAVEKYRAALAELDRKNVGRWDESGKLDAHLHDGIIRDRRLRIRIR